MGRIRGPSGPGPKIAKTTPCKVERGQLVALLDRPRCKTVTGECHQKRTPDPSCYCELLAIRIGNECCVFPIWLSRQESGKSDRGRRGLMTSFLRWRQAFKSAVMMRDHSQPGAGPVRTMSRD